jgi:hypothetical protein
MNIEQMCADAQSRVAQHVNRSAGQQRRAMKSQQQNESHMSMLELLHCIGCESETGDKHMGLLLALAGISRAELDAHTMPDPGVSRRAALADPLSIGTPAPVMLAFN